jgi:hypothetical protein
MFRPKPPRRHQRHVRSPRHPTPQIEHIFPFPGVCSRTCIHAVSCAYFLPAAHGVNRESESPSSPLRFRRAGPVPGECSRHAMLHTPPPLSAVAPQPSGRAESCPSSAVMCVQTLLQAATTVDPPDTGKTCTHRAAHDVSVPRQVAAASCVLPHHHRSRWRAREISRFRSTCSLHPMPAAWCVPSSG